MTAVFWCHSVITAEAQLNRVRIIVGDDGLIASVESEVEPEAADTRFGTVMPGMGNAHSHAFHRALRGATHDDGGDFWNWRQTMYAIAGALDPELYYRLARAVFAEMLVCGWTVVGEFHYLHHQPDGTPYPEPHAMELALARAAREVGIRLVILDTAYLSGGIARPLEENQLAFGDGSAAAYLSRWYSLRAALEEAADGMVGLGAAIHSIRAADRESISTILRGLPETTPVHIHLSERKQENYDSLAAYGETPTGVLHRLGALSPRTSLIHGTHLTVDDTGLIGDSGCTVVMCPTTESDLGDGIGPTHDLVLDGARIALGTDQNAVIDPFLEMRGLEMGERLVSGRRGRLTPGELLSFGTTSGYEALGLAPAQLREGDVCDFIEIEVNSLRTVGAQPSEIPLVATAADVLRVVVGGRVVVQDGRLTSEACAPSTPVELYADVLPELSLRQI